MQTKLLVDGAFALGVSGSVGVREACVLTSLVVEAQLVEGATASYSYVQVLLGKATAKTSKVKKRTAHPVWNEHVELYARPVPRRLRPALK